MFSPNKLKNKNSKPGLKSGWPQIKSRHSAIFIFQRDTVFLQDWITKWIITIYQLSDGNLQNTMVCISTAIRGYLYLHIQNWFIVK